MPGNAGELDALADAGVRGFKCFLAPSGVDEFPTVGEADLREALPVLARRGVPLLVHAEDAAVPCGIRRDAVRIATYLASRPPIAERAAIDLVTRLADEFNARVHIVHLACAEGVDAVARAKAAGVKMTAETCPHYLTFTADEIPEGATEFKCAPPIREARHREALWRALAEGTLDLIATDHSPAPSALKTPGDFAKAWGGIASLELSLASCNTGVMSPTSGCDPSRAAGRIAAWMSAAPARLAALDRKGRLQWAVTRISSIWDPDAEWTVDAGALQQRHKLTPYAGRTLRGAVRATFVRGECVWRDGVLVRAAQGQLL